MVSGIDCQPLRVDDVEFPYIDDGPIIFDNKPEGIKYNPYNIPKPSGAGGFLDKWG